MECGRERQVTERALAQQSQQDFLRRRQLLHHAAWIGRAARQLAQCEFQQQGDCDARQPHDQKCRAPAVVVADPAAEHQPEEGADVAAHLEDRQRRRATAGIEVIADQRVRRGVAPCLADCDADPCDHHVHKGLRHARQSREHAPREQRNRNDVDAVVSVCETRERHAHYRVEQCERRAGEQTHVPVEDAELGADRLDQHRGQLPVHEADRVDAAQQPGDVVPIGVGDADGGLQEFRPPATFWLLRGA
jgi:hypothetical protein